MADFNFVTRRLAVGAALKTQADVNALASAGITDVIDCRDDFDDTALFAKRSEIKVLWDGTADDGQPKPPAWFEKGIEFAIQALGQPRRKVYIHCKAGVHRGPSMAYAILVAEGLHGGTAEKLIRAARPQIDLRYRNDADRAIRTLGY